MFCLRQQCEVVKKFGNGFITKRLTLADDISLWIETENGLAGPSFGFLGRAMRLQPSKGEERMFVAAVNIPRSTVSSRMRGESHLQDNRLAMRCERDEQHKKGI
jgi:hypothetical protein